MGTSRSTIAAVTLLGLGTTAAAVPDSVVFALGERDDTYAEFALAREGHQAFREIFPERIEVNADDPGVPLDPAFRAELLETKATVFSALEVERAEAIGKRRAEPMADFLIEASPPAIFVNFEIPPEQRAGLAAAIPLPRGFRLAPIEPISGAR